MSMVIQDPHSNNRDEGISGNSFCKSLYSLLIFIPILYS